MDVAMNLSLSNTTGQLPYEHEMPAGVEIQSIKTEKRTSLKVKGVTEEMKALSLEPLQDGWTREIRLRRASIRPADVYYFAPDGTRFRSRLEIMKYLEKNFITKYNINNFSFYPAPLGGYCADYEVVRMCQPGFRSKVTYDQNDCNVPAMGKSEEKMKPVVAEPLKQWIPRNMEWNSLEPTTQYSPNDKLYCICTNVEWRQMVKCCNEGCAIKLYHLRCVLLSEVPKDSQPWYCPICRDSDSGTLNPAYATQN